MSKKILIADDQVGIRRLLIEVLSMESYLLESAANGMEAIEKVEEFKPDLMLLDMKMPGLSGLETLAKIRENDNELKVIMMTAYGELEIVEEARKLGVLGHLTKPFDLMELNSMVKSALG